MEFKFINLINYFSLVIICIGLFGLILYRKNLIFLLISLEIFLLGINLNFVLTSLIFDDLIGYIFSLFILAIAGSEVSVGLALTILFYRTKNNIFIDSINYLKG